MGRDHTIFAMAKGFVRFYQDPIKHPKRKYIGVALDAKDQLPTPVGEPRRRRLGMEPIPLSVSIPIPDATEPNIEVRASLSIAKEGDVKPRRAKDGTLLTMGKNYAFSNTNWEIGRAAETAGITRRVRPFNHKDRWIAWEKRTKRRKAAAERKAVLGTGKKKAKRDPGKGKARAIAMAKRP
jgi:large subunit ribosomal protein L27